MVLHWRIVGYVDLIGFIADFLCIFLTINA